MVGVEMVDGEVRLAADQSEVPEFALPFGPESDLFLI